MTSEPVPHSAADLPAWINPSDCGADCRVRSLASVAWRASVCAVLLGIAVPAWAISLGEAQTTSRIGDVLQVQIPLSATPDEALNADCIRLEGPRNDTAEELPWLRAGRVKLSTQADGQQVVVISSLQSVQSPVIMLAVRVACNTTLRREYTLLLNPPRVNEVQAPTLPVSPTPPNTSENIWRVANGENLRLIARGLFPNDKALQARYRELLRQRNTVKLQGYGDTTKLPVGMELSVPEMSELKNERNAPAPVTPSSAALPTRRASVGPSSAQDTKTEARAPRKSLVSASRQRLVVGGDERVGLQLATGLSGRKELSEKEREKLRTELQLIATLDEKIATQLELSEKLRQLEALQVQLQSDVQSLETRIRAQQALLQGASSPSAMTSPSAQNVATDKSTAPRPLPVPAATSKNFAWADWVLPVTAIIGLLFLLVGWRYYRNRHTADPEQEEAAASIQGTASQEQPAEDLFERLSEEDIWPDAAATKRPLGTTPSGDLPSLSTLGPTSILHVDEDVEEHNSAVELAEIMMSFGRVQGAAQTLADFIRANPKQAVKPWVKLLEVYKTANMRPEFEALTSQLNKTFNVKPVTWDDFDVALRAPESLEHIEHVAAKLCETWGKRECQAYLHMLLRDNRQGTRQGFPLAMVDEILLLLAILEAQLGPYKADAEPVPPAVPDPTPATITAATTPSGAAPATQTPTLPMMASTTPLPMSSSWSPKLPGEQSSSMNFDLSATDFDLGLNTDDLTRTLHINLDDLPDEPSATNFNPRKPEES